MLAQSFGLEDGLLQHVLHFTAFDSSDDAKVLLYDATESTRSAAGMPVANLGDMSHTDDFMVQSSHPEKRLPLFENISPVEDLPQNVINITEYLPMMQHDLSDGSVVFQTPHQECSAHTEEPPCITRPEPLAEAQLRPFRTRPRLGGVSTYPLYDTAQIGPQRIRPGDSDEESGLGVTDLSEFSDSLDVFDLDQLAPGGLDPRLKEAWRRCKGEGSLQPLLKEELRLKILKRRHDSGQGDIDVQFEEPPQYEMTVQEQQRRDNRRAQNRGAAQRFRQRKKSRELELKQKIEEDQRKNAELKSEVEVLRRETTRLRSILELHFNSGECLLQQNSFMYWPDVTSLCQQISAEEVDGRPAFSP